MAMAFMDCCCASALNRWMVSNGISSLGFSSDDAMILSLSVSVSVSVSVLWQWRCGLKNLPPQMISD